MATINGRAGGSGTITGAITHTGTTAGFYSTTPAARPSAYTQTYSTADKVHNNLTASDLTDNTGATPDTTIANVPAAVAALVDTTAASLTSTNTSLTAIGNNISDLAAQHDALLVDVADLKQFINSVVDDLQTLGLLQ